MEHSTHEFAVYDPKTNQIAGEVTNARVTADASWSPRFTADITLAGDYKGITYAHTDAPEYVGIRMRRINAPGVAVSEYTTKIGARLALYTAAKGSGPLRNLTNKVDGTPTAAPPVETRMVLMVKSQVQDYITGETQLSLTSCEMILQDLKRMMITTWDGTGFQSTQELVRYLITQATGDARLVESTASSTPETFTRPPVWQPGESIWDLINQALIDKELTLWADAPDRYHLTHRPSAAYRKLALTKSEMVSLSRHYDSDEDVYSMLYSESVQGTDHTNFSLTGFYGIHRGVVESTSGPGPARSAVYSPIQPSYLGRRRVTCRITTSARYELEPDHAVEIKVPYSLEVNTVTSTVNESTYKGFVSEIAWRYPDGLMDITLDQIEQVS